MSITKLLTAIKGGAGSGNFGHSGRPGKIGGSAGGSALASQLPWVDGYNEIVTKKGLHHPILDDEFEHFPDIASDVKAKKLRAEGGFGLCALHSLNACKDNPNLDVAVGLVLTTDDVAAIKRFDPVKYWDMSTIGLTHVWNVDKATGQVVDNAMGSTKAADRVYLGKIVPNASKFRSDDELLNYAEDFVSSKYPKDFSTQDAEFEKWNAGRK